MFTEGEVPPSHFRFAADPKVVAPPACVRVIVPFWPTEAAFRLEKVISVLLAACRVIAKLLESSRSQVATLAEIVTVATSPRTPLVNFWSAAPVLTIVASAASTPRFVLAPAASLAPVPPSATAMSVVNPDS